jgi:mannan endo-1,4-beta-mannosidase
MHIWPKNWGWLDPEDIPGSIDKSIVSTNEYMDRHIALARKHNKPIVMEEFGLPRDHHQYNLTDPTTCRDKYYKNTFDQIASHAKNKDVFAGCNFWAWGGFARPTEGHIFWQAGDDYMGDPAQEEQGLNAVFDTDSTIPLIKEYAALLNY